jgi:glycosyltransferase involved in cell wall biosynthesis
VVLPCLNEAAALPAVLAAVPAGMRAIVVDNGSTDGSADIARAHGATVVTEPQAGYGAAVHAGVLAASAPLLGVIDADGSMDPAVLSGLAEVVERGVATMAVGRRRPVRRGVWPWHARAGTALIAARLRRRAGVPVHDIAPVRVCRRQDLLDLDVQDRRFGYPLELLVKAAAAGWVLHEVDIDYRPRAVGTRSKVSGSVRGTLRAARDFASVLP